MKEENQANKGGESVKDMMRKRGKEREDGKERKEA